MIEFAVTQENGTYIQTLKSASLYLENASGNLESLKDNLNEKLDKIHQEKQRELDAREKKLDDQQRLLDRASESAENERSTLIQLVKTLETKLNTISQVLFSFDYDSISHLTTTVPSFIHYYFRHLRKKCGP